MTPESLASVELVDANLWNTGLRNESLGGWRVHTGKRRHGQLAAAKEVDESFENLSQCKGAPTYFSTGHLSSVLRLPSHVNFLDNTL